MFPFLFYFGVTNKNSYAVLSCSDFGVGTTAVHTASPPFVTSVSIKRPWKGQSFRRKFLQAPDPQDSTHDEYFCISFNVISFLYILYFLHCDMFFYRFSANKTYIHRNCFLRFLCLICNNLYSDE